MNQPRVLDEQIKDTIRSALERLRANTPGFKERSGQKRMIAEVAKTLSGIHR